MIIIIKTHCEDAAIRVSSGLQIWCTCNIYFYWSFWVCLQVISTVRYMERIYRRASLWSTSNSSPSYSNTPTCRQVIKLAFQAGPSQLILIFLWWAIKHDSYCIHFYPLKPRISAPIFLISFFPLIPQILCLLLRILSNIPSYIRLWLSSVIVYYVYLLFSFRFLWRECLAHKYLGMYCLLPDDIRRAFHIHQFQSEHFKSESIYWRSIKTGVLNKPLGVIY